MDEGMTLKEGSNNHQRKGFSPFLGNPRYSKLQQLVQMWKEEEEEEEEQGHLVADGGLSSSQQQQSRVKKATDLLVEIISNETNYIQHKPNSGMLFIKTFKTGSSTLSSMVYSIATSHKLIAPVTRRSIWYEEDYDTDFVLQQPTTKRNIHHAPYDVLFHHVMRYDNLLLADVVPSAKGRYFSILRDPATRVRSANYFCASRSFKDDKSCQFTKEQLDQFSWEDLVLGLGNYTTTTLEEAQMRPPCVPDMSTLQIVGHGLNPNASFEDNLQSTYQKVADGDLLLMVMERMLESLIVLWDMYELHPLDVTFMAMKVQSYSSSSSSSSATTPTTRKEEEVNTTKSQQADQLVRDLNPLDTAMHKHANEVLTQRLQKLFSISGEEESRTSTSASAKRDTTQSTTSNSNQPVIQQAVSELSILNDIVDQVCHSILGRTNNNPSDLVQIDVINAAKSYTTKNGNGLGYWCLEKALDYEPWSKFHTKRLRKEEGNDNDDVISYYKRK